jgi:hypothetical protein
MGNSVSHKKDVDLSPQALTQTSDDDKVWLDVTEENLFNETFTNEKYYLLHSRNEIVDYIPSHTQKREIRLGREEQARKRAEELLPIVQESRTKTITATLISDLQQSLIGKHTLYYDSVLQKRISILKRIHLAMNREKAREKVKHSLRLRLITKKAIHYDTRSCHQVSQKQCF